MIITNNKYYPENQVNQGYRGIEKINVSSLTKGNYFVSFGTNGINKFAKKFIVQ